MLQHITDVGEALREFARVTRPDGRILAVEPDNAARYWYSSCPAGMDAFAEARSVLRRPGRDVAARWWSRESGRG